MCPAADIFFYYYFYLGSSFALFLYIYTIERPRYIIVTRSPYCNKTNWTIKSTQPAVADDNWTKNNNNNKTTGRVQKYYRVILSKAATVVGEINFCFYTRIGRILLLPPR